MKKILILTAVFCVGCSRTPTPHEEFLDAAMQLEKSWSHEDYMELKDHSFYCSCQSEGADFYDELFKYSWIMANKYNDSTACEDVAFYILSMYKSVDLDSVSANLIVEYWKKGAMLGNSRCETALYLVYSGNGRSRAFRKFNMKDSILAEKYCPPAFRKAQTPQ